MRLGKATYEKAEANLLAAYDEVRGLVAECPRSNRFKLQHCLIEDV